jgi:hypothetical protein
MQTSLRLCDDQISVSDITDRVDELRSDLQDVIDEAGNNDPAGNQRVGAWRGGDDGQELTALESLLSELRGYGGDHQWEGDWYPAMLIADSYFEDYAQELAEDCGMVTEGASWPNNCIDWERAARELQGDYSSITVDGSEYWYR